MNNNNNNKNKENFRVNIQQAKENFEKNSLKINKKPFFLERLDKYNVIIYELKKNKESNLAKYTLGYYGRLQNALRVFFKLLTKKEPLLELFSEYKTFNPEQCTKDIQREITTKLNKYIKEKKWVK